MNFEINDFEKLRIKRRRYRYEKKWRPFRIACTILNIVSIIIPLWKFYYIFYLGNMGVRVDDIGQVLFGWFIPAACSWFIRMCVANMTSQWVTDMFHEELRVENGIMIRSNSHSLGQGAMALVEGQDRFISEMIVDSIHNLKINERSGRIEFLCSEHTVYYDDWKRKIVHFDLQQTDVRKVFYDYYKPSLIEYMKSLNIPYVEGDMKFKMSNE